ncbi:hypothetical protein ACFW5X_28435 [Streptomyces albogriseolus]|uniref:hypothetical protein n=1 Tax=Streptomyces albogriseolus TaxID=1887 RepID=UPI00368A6E7E
MSETPTTLLDLARNALNARMAKDDLRLVLENVIGYAATLEKRIEAVRREHTPYDDSEHCQYDGEPWPCLTMDALGETRAPRTERQRWQDIADALNAAHAAGMPVGIDLDGTLTDRNAWSVVWDRSAERWTVAGYEDGDVR